MAAYRTEDVDGSGGVTFSVQPPRSQSPLMSIAASVGEARALWATPGVPSASLQGDWQVLDEFVCAFVGHFS